MAKRNTSVYFDRASQKFQGLSESVMQDLCRAFKGVSVETELVRMQLWLNSPKGSRRKGTLSFITKWLTNNSKHTKPSEFDLVTQDASLDAFVADYLEDLWKAREYLLSFNTIQKKA